MREEEPLNQVIMCVIFHNSNIVVYKTWTKNIFQQKRNLMLSNQMIIGVG